MKKMMTYTEANQVLGSSLSPNNYCICKLTAIENGADTTPLTTFEYNRLVPASAVSRQDQSLQYHITFADGRSYAEGVYFYMNDGSFVPVANSSSISANDVAYVAWLGLPTMSNGLIISGSFLIDKNESSTSVAYTTDGTNEYESYSHNVYTNGSYGYEYSAVLLYMLNSPVVQYCSTTFNGDGQAPSTSQLYNMLHSIDDVNAALLFIGGTPLKTNTDVGSSSDDFYYRMQNKYWSCNAGYESENDVYTYGMYCVGGYLQYVSRPVIDPQTHETTTERYSVPNSSGGLATSSSITAFVRAIKPIDEQAPTTPTGTIYYEYDVNAGTIPECPQEYEPQNTETEMFIGWNPTLYAANKNEVYTVKWMSISPGDDPSNPYHIYCNGVSNGGTVLVDVHTTSVDISWSGPDPIDSQWDVTGGGSGGSAQAGYHSWGSGYVNGLNFTSTTTIQSGGYVGYTVIGVHPQSGESISISGYWPVEVVESHS